MKLVDVSCPHCGAGLTITDNTRTVHCEYCNHDFIVDDELIHVAHSIDDAEQLRYDLETGRQRYMREQEGEKNILQSGLCPHCGTVVFMDKTHTTEICYKCHKEINTEAANLFERANLQAEFEPETKVIQYYDKALALQNDGHALIDFKRRMHKKAVIGKIKLCIFNPIVLGTLFISTIVCGASGNHALLQYFPTLFLLTIFYPVFWEMAYIPLTDALGIGFLLLLVICYMVS